MKITLTNGEILEATGIEECFYPRNTQGTILSIRMTSEQSVDELREFFTPETVAQIQIGEGENTEIVNGYTQIDSVRKIYGNDSDYNVVVDLVKEQCKEITGE